MKTQLTQSNRRRSVPVRRINIVPLLAILVVAAIGITLTLLFPMEWARTPNVTVSAETGAISPNGDGNLDTVPVMYSLSEDATVTVEVLDAGRSVVRVLMEEELQATGQHTTIWDGLDRLGQVLPDGKYFVRITAQATLRSAASTVQVDVDTQAPIIRLANLPEDTQVGGDTSELLIEGVTDPDATVWLNDWFQSLEVSDEGSFSVVYSLLEGVNRIELVAVDDAGNQASIVREITLLTEPPDIVVLNPPDGLWINVRMLSVQGAVPSGIRVRVNQTEANVDEEGNFNVDIVLDEGENIVRIEAIDAVENVSVEERRVYLDTQPPALSLTSVRDGMTVREPSLLVVGQTVPQTNVWLNGRELVVDSQGGFQGLVELIEGENIVRVEAMDRAGNKSVLVREVAYSSEPARATLPPAVRNVLAVSGASIAGVVILWIISGIWQRPLSLMLRTTRSTLYPGADGRLEPAVVVFETSRPATVTAEVWDVSNRHVATVFRRQRRSQGEHLLVWDGRNDEGQIAPAGAYEIEVSANTMFTTVSSSTRLSIEERTLRPALERVDQHYGQPQRRGSEL
ncbi:MAG: FlgD immunoglobulin-like domain containing protein [Anaerolineae bacterium]